ncbi:NUDIX hydrolase [Filimonas effusa]|uniref:NUDIX hydrolase n=1 Tax=Filimonas effusa TaxID=2508721 RepID=A0A4Q1D230_9BACT|nr:NUDIX hydrolase [Filimonas effusa]RXK81926.1 NUDIX hydrolase [Filimonas effusa]
MNKEPASVSAYDTAYPRIAMTVDCIIFSFDGNELKVLLLHEPDRPNDQWSLTGKFASDEEELDDVACRVLQQHTGIESAWVEQLRTFIHPRPAGKVLTVAYCALINSKDQQLQLSGSLLQWHSVRELQFTEFGHKDLVSYCYKWLQKRIQEHPLGFNLLPEKFSLREMQNLYEAVLETRLDRRNFRKKFFAMDLLVDTGEYENDVPHRPGKLYTFNFRKYEECKPNGTGITFL